jgi:hypothetical protein
MYSGDDFGAFANFIAPAPTGVFAVGSANTPAGQEHWIVRQYTGTIVNMEDDFAYLPMGTNSQPEAMTSNSSGNIYVAGNYTDGSSRQHWLIRESSKGTWNNIDDYQYSTNTSTTPLGIAMSSSNELYAVGVTSSYAAPRSWWIVREYSGGASSLVDSFQYVADFSSEQTLLRPMYSETFMLLGTATTDQTRCTGLSENFLMEAGVRSTTTTM